nr:RNA-directed DNA polymerase, eukaryota, reverse transcriptase zinc-binding domain protein [Tanacetum cinerariifolium]
MRAVRESSARYDFNSSELSLAALIFAGSQQLGTLQNRIVSVISERGDTAAWKLHWDAGLVTMVYGGVICSGLGYYLGVLDCFNSASGLRINMTKSKLLGISLEDDKVKQAAAKIGCNTLKTPFSYLGSKVGGCMARIQSWNETIERMACRLSKWKLKTLSIRGRLTLLKSVLGSMPIYHMSLFKVPKKVLHRMEFMRSIFFNGAELSSKKSVWVKWKHALASKDKIGLGVSSLFAINRALMFKWKVKSCYPSLWLDIIHEVDIFKSRGIDLVSLIHSKLGNGANTSFWEVAWREGSPFKSPFP